MANAHAWLIVVAVFVTHLSVAHAQSSAQANPPLLTLAEAVELALRYNDRLITLDESLDQANLSVSVARSAFAPKVVPNVLGSFGQTDISNQTYGLDTSKRFSFGTELRSRIGTSTFQNQLGNFYNTETTFAISQPFLRGFGRGVGRRGLDSAEGRAANAMRQQIVGEQQVGVEVAAAYYQLIAESQLVDVARVSLESARNLLEASTAKLRAGIVSQLDVLRAQQLVAQAEGQLFDAEAAVEDARDQLRYLIGRGPDYQFTVGAEIPEEVELITPEAAVELALENRLEFRNAEEALADAEGTVSFARNQLLPQVDVNLALTRRETADSLGSAFGVDKFGLATFFAISMPLDRTPDVLGLHNAVIARDRQRRAIETLRLRIVGEARRAARQQQRLVRSLDVADAGVEFAQEEVELATLRYQRGLSNNLDLVNAEANLLGASTRRLSILAQLAVSRLSLLAVLGTLDPRTDVR